MKSILLFLLATPLVAGCTTVPPPSGREVGEARIGQRVDVGGPKVTPLKVLEDSRCPVEVDCVWGGRVQIEVKVETGRSSKVLTLSTDQPLPVADGTLTLAGVVPERSNKRTIAPDDYRFVLKFSGEF